MGRSDIMVVVVLSFSLLVAVPDGVYLFTVLTVR